MFVVFVQHACVGVWYPCVGVWYRVGVYKKMTLYTSCLVLTLTQWQADLRYYYIAQELINTKLTLNLLLCSVMSNNMLKMPHIVGEAWTDTYKLVSHQ